MGTDDHIGKSQRSNHNSIYAGKYHKKDRGLSMGFLLLLCALAFILVFWITSWGFFKTLATICVALAVVWIAVSWIKSIFS